MIGADRIMLFMKRTSFVYSAIFVACLLVWNLTGQPFVRVDALSTNVVAPHVVTVTTDAQYVFTASTVRADGRVIARVIQNTGTVPVLYAIGSVASTTSYHGILAGGNAIRDGLGSVVDLSKYSGQVSLITASGSSTVCLVELQQ
jgi:hypothetical protein